MSITAAELVAIVAVRGADEAALKLAAVGGAVDSAGAKFAMLATGAIVLAGAALAGVGVVAVKMAGDFQQGITRLVTGAGDVTDNMAKMGQGILQVSTATGTLTNGTDGLNAAMYLIVSSGQRGAMALNTLKMAAEGAKIEQAKVVDVAQILSVLMTNFGRTTHTAAQYMDGLIAAVAHGQISLEDLSTAMSPILPNAKELGIHFADVAAAMSEMTNKGIPADQAATALRFTMQSMILPTKGSQKAMIEWGLDTAKVAAEMKVSLPGAIQMYINAAKRAGPEGSKPFIDALSQMMGGGQRSAKALFALSQAMGEWRTIIGQVNTALGDMSKNVSGWDTVQGNFNLQLDKGKAALAALAISIGQQLLPYVTQLMLHIIPLVVSFADWVTTSGAVTAAIQNTGNAIQNVIGFYRQWKPVIDTTALALAVFFTPAIIMAGVQAVISAGKIMFNFVASLIMTGAQGWAAAFKLALYIGALIATGAQAAIAGAIIAGRFVFSLIATAIQAGIAASAMYGGMIPALYAVGASALATAGRLLVSLIPALYAMGVAFYAALGPIGLVLGAVALAIAAFAAMKHQSDVMSLGVSGSFDTMGNQVQRSTGRIMQTADQMKNGVSNSANQMKNNVDSSFNTMQAQSIADVQMLTSDAMNMFANMGTQVGIDMSNMSSSAIGYWNGVANYIANHPITGSVQLSNQGGNLHHMAEGSNYAPGGLSLIGERGPEIMYIPRGAQIIPNNKIGQMSSQASSSSQSGQPVIVQINMNGQQLMRAFMPEFVQAVRQATGAKF